LKYLPLVWNGLWRNRARTLFTLLSVTVAFILFGILAGVDAGFAHSLEASRMDRLFADPKFGAPMPISYAEQIAPVAGVLVVAPARYDRLAGRLIAASVAGSESASSRRPADIRWGNGEALVESRDHQQPADPAETGCQTPCQSVDVRGRPELVKPRPVTLVRSSSLDLRLSSYMPPGALHPARPSFRNTHWQVCLCRPSVASSTGGQP
jgi:hypothetical protein